MLMLQRAIWEAELQANEWQQRLAQQQRYRSGQSRFNLTRNVSMPSSNKLSNVEADGTNSENSSIHQKQHLLPCVNPISASAAGQYVTPALGQSRAEALQLRTLVPCMKAPCTNLDSPPQCLLPDVPSLTGLVSKSLLRSSSSSKCSSSSSPYRSPYTRSSSTGAAKAAKRRMSDVGSAASKPYQPVLGLAAKARAASQSASALSSAAASPQHQQAVAAARVKACSIERAGSLTSTYGTVTAACNADVDALPGGKVTKESDKLALVK